MSESSAKNYNILPHFTEDSKGIRIDTEEYDKVHFKSIALRNKAKKLF
jgi:hypothetical protein